MNKSLIVAEVGPNHNGSFNLAIEYIERLSHFDIDVVKFQLANPEKVYSKDSFKAEYQKLNDKSETILEMSKANQLTKEEHIKLYDECAKRNIKYAVTVFDLESLKFIDQNLNLPFIKIPSGEVCSIDILEYAKKSNKDLILSTGMSDPNEIKQAVNFIDPESEKNISILHCVSTYPVGNDQINLNYIETLHKLFPRCRIGYSDHSIGEEACLLALAKGASIIEKHVTIDNNLNGPDHKSSMLIDDFGRLVNKLRKSEVILGKNKKLINHEQLAIRNMAMKSIVSKNAIKKNQVLKIENLCFKRPGTGISPMKIEEIIGCRVNKDIEKDRVIKFEDLYK